MSGKPQLRLNQIWTYVGKYNRDDETVRLIAKNIEDRFEYKTLFGNRTGSSTFNPLAFKIDAWVYDPESKGSQYWRDKNEQ